MTSWRQPSIVRASNHALVARSSNTTTSVSQSHRRREEELMAQRRVHRVARNPPRQSLGVNECSLALSLEIRGAGGKPAARAEGEPRFAGVSSDARVGQQAAALEESRAIPESGEFAWSVRRASRWVGFDFGEGFAAAFANRRIARVFPDVPRVVPAALALLPVRALNFDLQARQGFAWRQPMAFGGIDHDL